jgi:predicted NBD/HSP70 family sugar kinase
VALLERVEKLARAKDPRIVQVMAGLAGEYDVVLVARADGTLAADVRPLVRLSVTVIAEQTVNGEVRREVGSGGGGGRVIGGQVLAGAGGYAGEWGHGPVIRGEFALRCGCGQVGCVDTIGSARGLERLHRKRTAELLGSEAIIAGWVAGEAEAGATMALWRELVAGPLALVLNVRGAAVVPVGGGLSRAPGLVRYLDEAVRVRILRRTRGPLLVPAECGADAGLLGAAMAGIARWA